MLGLHAKKTDKATEAVKTFVLAIKLVSVNILRLGEKSEKTEYFNILSHALQKVDAIVILEKNCGKRFQMDAAHWLLKSFE